MYNRNPKGKKKETMEASNPLSFRNVMNDVKTFGGSYTRTWNEKKALENKRVVELGGKPQKKPRVPLSVARVQMKKTKEREEKMLKQNLILGKFGGQLGGGGGSTKKPVEKKRKPEDRVLKSLVGNFKNGVLDARPWLNANGTSKIDYREKRIGNYSKINIGGEMGGGGGGKKSKGGKKKGKGKKKGGGKKKGK